MMYFIIIIMIIMNNNDNIIVIIIVNYNFSNENNTHPLEKKIGTHRYSVNTL